MATIGANGLYAAACTTPCGGEWEIAKDADAASAVGYQMVASLTAAAKGGAGTDVEGKGVVHEALRHCHGGYRRRPPCACHPARRFVHDNVNARWCYI